MTLALLNGQPASVDDLRALALVNYGHFTTFQVRQRAMQGMQLHCERLLSGHRELFGAELDFRAVRTQLHAAVADTPDCRLRVTVFSRSFDVRKPTREIEADVLLTVSAASGVHDLPLRLKSFGFQRYLPQVKQVGTFALFHQRRQAMAAGHDDALFVQSDGIVCEGPTWNIGFWQQGRVVWPQAPALRGTTERLLQETLASRGVGQSTRPVSLAEVQKFDGAFACNAGGIQPVAGIDETVFADPGGGLGLLRECLATVPWERI